MTISFTGLASGIDSASLVSQLVGIEKQPAQLLATQQSDLASKKSIVDNIASKIGALGDLATGMSLDSEVQFRTGSASDNHVSIAVSGAATPATHAVRVEQLARAQVVSSKTFTTDKAGVLGDGSVQLNGSTTVSWTASDSLEAIAGKINDAHAGVAASVLYDGSTYRIVATSTKTGTANATAFVDSGDGLALSDSANIKIPAKNAIVDIDGVPVSRPTNVIDDALSGVTITANSAQAATDPDTDVTVAVDRDAIKGKLNDFVKGYNAIASALHAQIDYTGTKKGTNTLFGDSTMRQLQGALVNIALTKFGTTSLSDVGLTIDKTGQMSLDSTKLTTAIDNDSNLLSTLFVGGGFSASIKSFVNGYTEAGDGILTMQSNGYTSQSKGLQTQIDEINARGDALDKRLTDQFSALEETMSRLQSQTSYISKLLA